MPINEAMASTTLLLDKLLRVIIDILILKHYAVIGMMKYWRRNATLISWRICVFGKVVDKRIIGLQITLVFLLNVKFPLR